MPITVVQLKKWMLTTLVLPTRRELRARSAELVGGLNKEPIEFQHEMVYQQNINQLHFDWNLLYVFRRFISIIE